LLELLLFTLMIQLSIAQLIPRDTNFTNNSSGGSELI